MLDEKNKTDVLVMSSLQMASCRFLSGPAGRQRSNQARSMDGIGAMAPKASKEVWVDVLILVPRRKGTAAPAVELLTVGNQGNLLEPRPGSPKRSLMPEALVRPLLLLLLPLEAKKAASLASGTQMGKPSGG